MSMLSEGKEKIDVMIVNVHSSSMLYFHLLAQAVSLDIISLVVCDEHNELVAKKALAEGAYLSIRKPFNKNIVTFLWQFVLKKKIQKEKEREGSKRITDQMNFDYIFNNNIAGDNEEPNREKKRGRKSSKEIQEEIHQTSVINQAVRRQTCTIWTDNLHAKFMEAIHQLGEGRCYPKEILEVMNVPGLTRTQISSHLQKCRSNSWRAPRNQKAICDSLSQASSSGTQQKNSFKNYGAIPRLPNLQCNLDQMERGSEFSFSVPNINNIFARGKSLIQQQLYHPQPQVQPQAQNNVGGGLQQHGPSFGLLGSQGLQGPTIGNIIYKPGLTFNNSDHYTQSDYNLNLNAAHDTTYSSSGIMSDTNIDATINYYNLNVNLDNVTTYSRSAMISNTGVANSTINELGAANANFQQNIGESNEHDDELFQVHFDDQVNASL
ncbi:two-component response regulator ORR21-like [Capsicum galapagoense]